MVTAVFQLENQKKTVNWIFIGNPNRLPNKDAKTERGLNPASNTPHITYNKQTKKKIH